MRTERGRGVRGKKSHRFGKWATHINAKLETIYIFIFKSRRNRRKSGGSERATEHTKCQPNDAKRDDERANIKQDMNTRKCAQLPNHYWSAHDAATRSQWHSNERSNMAKGIKRKYASSKPNKLYRKLRPDDTNIHAHMHATAH